MRFKDEFCSQNQTKKFSFFYKLDRIIVLFQNRIHAFLSGQKFMATVLFLEIEKPFLRAYSSKLLVVCRIFLDSIDKGRFVHNNKFVHIERTFNTRVILLHNIIDLNIE